MRQKIRLVSGPLYVIKKQLETYRATGRIESRPIRRGDEFQEIYAELVQALGGKTPDKQVIGSDPIATATSMRPRGFAARARRKCSAPCFCVCQCMPVVRSS